jgi:hypothetical protein
MHCFPLTGLIPPANLESWSAKQENISILPFVFMKVFHLLKQQLITIWATRPWSCPPARPHFHRCTRVENLGEGLPDVFCQNP